MKYLTCQEIADIWGISARRVQQMCKNGEIETAKKEKGSWLIPENAELPSALRSSNAKSIIGSKKKPLPIGISDFKKATTDYYYVDKTLLIQDFLDSKPQVSLFTRPRRFGKTLSMDMLRVFFEKTNSDTSIYFKDKKIWECGSEYTNYQGQYPVIFLTFKDVKCTTWEDTYDMIGKLITLEFARHQELATSDKLTEYQKEQYNLISNGEASGIDYQMSLQLLSLFLYKHYNKECIIIIDEYDTPIQQGHVGGYYTQVIDFMRNFFSGGLKDNPCLAYGFLTGILRIAKESIFSGLNNLKIYSILDEKFSQYFGFTKEEVKEILAYYNVSEKYDEVCQWYDGYLFGNTEIFNPWSVINYISDNCFPKAFWQSTGSNDIIGEIVSAATPEITESLHKLLTGEKITAYIDTSVIYPEIQKNPYSIYSFLLIAGYLKVSKNYPQFDGNSMCDIAIPNKEISFVYEKEVLSRTGKGNVAVDIQQAIFSNDIQRLQKLLEQYLMETVSVFDATDEKFYHGMMLGLCAIVSNKYRVRSNRESGLGRYDIVLFPEYKDIPAFIFELKHTKNEKDLVALAESGLNQIDSKKYETELRASGITNIIKVSIAFNGKKTEVRTR